MSLTPAMIDALVASGCTAEQLAAVVKAALAEDEARREAKRAGNRERQRRHRLNNAMSRDVTHVTRDTPSPLCPPDKEIPPAPPKEITPPISPQPRAVPRDLLDRLLDAAGICGNPNPALVHPGQIIALIQAGYDLEVEILPAIRAKPKPDLRSWNWYVPIIRESADGNRKIASEPRHDPLAALRSWPDSKWQVVLDHSRQRREWLLTYGPAPGQAGCLVPEHLLKPDDREMARVAA